MRAADIVIGEDYAVKNGFTYAGFSRLRVTSTYGRDASGLSIDEDGEAMVYGDRGYYKDKAGKPIHSDAPLNQITMLWDDQMEAVREAREEQDRHSKLMADAREIGTSAALEAGVPEYAPVVMRTEYDPVGDRYHPVWYVSFPSLGRNAERVFRTAAGAKKALDVVLKYTAEISEVTGIARDAFEDLGATR